MIIVIANQKGGVGKSTIATNLAVHLSGSGGKLQLIDHDTSHVSFNFMQRRQFADNLHTFKVSMPRDIDHMMNMLEDEIYAITVVDLGGFTDELARAALIYSDIVIVPTSISTHDMDGNLHFMQTLDKLKAVGVEMNVVFVANMTHPLMGTERIRNELNYIEDAGYKVIGHLPQSKLFSECHGLGMGVIEHAPESGAAIAMDILTYELINEANYGQK